MSFRLTDPFGCEAISHKILRFNSAEHFSHTASLLCCPQSAKNTLSSTVCKAKAIVNLLLRYHEINYLQDVDDYICLAAEKLCKSYVAPSLDPDVVQPDLDLD